jgi:hypothetical protein
MTDTGYVARDFVAVEQKINSCPEELSVFLSSPAKYLKKNGLSLSDSALKDIEGSMRDLQLGPRSLDDLTRSGKHRIRAGISIVIFF